MNETQSHSDHTDADESGGSAGQDPTTEGDTASGGPADPTEDDDGTPVENPSGG